ncbi:hypothetical protein BDZ91DRAFT_846403 [Kalaharituber pfeilii]|nr:hypothetical protein BDZ91DRAFT_846403 [Kalaharituber pfeilii]
MAEVNIPPRSSNALFPASEPQVFSTSGTAAQFSPKKPFLLGDGRTEAQELQDKPLSHFPLTHPSYPDLSPFELLLTIYTPILESLSNYLNTYEKLRLTHVSPHLRRLCHSYPSFWAHPDFHLVVREGGGYDSYGIGKVYNLDALLSILPLEGRLVSLNVDWTAITGHYLFKVVDKCAATLQHLSVRGCRKVSIKHHIVPHFVHQHLIEPYTISSRPELAGTGSGGWGTKTERPHRALKSLHAWKARGVRRKAFLIDRKEADGDEPTRYLTTLAAALDIFVDVGLCSTPKLRCPRRREITRRGREKYCVPFDRRWRETNTAVTELVPSLLKRGLGRDFDCDGCGEPIGERCEACAVAMHCSNCAKTLCHSCSWTVPFSSGSSSSGSSTSSGDGNNSAGVYATIDLDSDADPAAAGLIPAMKPCCVDTLPYNILTSSRSGEVYCEECYESLEWGKCDACGRSMCMKHEWERRKICGGGCGRAFCFPLIGGGPGPGGNAVQIGGGAVGCDMGGVRQCVGCGNFVCRDCRRQTACPCQLCTISFYCRDCWGSKPFSCDGDLMRRKAAAQISPASFSSTEEDSASLSSHHSSSQAEQVENGVTWIGGTASVENSQPAIFNENDEDDAGDEGEEEEEEEDGLEQEADAEEEEEEEGDEEENPATTSIAPETVSPAQNPQANFEGNQGQLAAAGNSAVPPLEDAMEQMSLLVLDDESQLAVNTRVARSPSIATGIQSPIATTPLTPAQTRPGSSAGSGVGTPTAQDLQDTIEGWDVIEGPSLS